MVKRERRSPRRSYSGGKKRHRMKAKPVFHAIPDLFEVGAAVELLGPAGQAVWDNRTNLSSINGSDLVKNQVIPQVVPAAELAVIGLALKWVGKKTGLSKIGTKGVKLF
jgi:hypothetical protein